MKRSELLALADGLNHMGLATCDEAAAILRQIAEAQPVAWLHDITRGVDDDQALSFSPDNFPLKGLFRSVGQRPLYTLPLED